MVITVVTPTADNCQRSVKRSLFSFFLSFYLPLLPWAPSTGSHLPLPDCSVVSALPNSDFSPPPLSLLFFSLPDHHCRLQQCGSDCTTGNGSLLFFLFIYEWIIIAAAAVLLCSSTKVARRATAAAGAAGAINCSAIVCRLTGIQALPVVVSQTARQTDCQ